jgi:ABC-type amino acid transport substrate-binding protein
MTITPDRQKVLDFSVPYYYTPAVVAVKSDSTLTSISELAGQAVCAGVSTTYETWLNGGDLGPTVPIIEKAPEGITVVALESDQECAQAMAAGRDDFVAYVTSETVVDANIAAALPVKKLGGPVYLEQLAAALDKGSTLSGSTLLAEIDKLFTAMHSDGRLSELSKKWFGADYTIGK